MEFLEFASAWFLAILTISLTNDSAAIAQCRVDLLDLEKQLESLRRGQPHRGLDVDPKKIKEIKETIKQLNMHYAGLFIKYHALSRMIDKSLDLICNWEEGAENSKGTTATAVDLGNIWGHTDRIYKTSTIKDIRSFFHAGLFKRMIIYIEEFIKSMMYNCNNEVVYAYLKSLVIFSILAALAYYLAHLANSYIFLTRNWIFFLKNLSVVIDVTLLFGHPGWEIQTWSGDSMNEELNKNLISLVRGLMFFLTMFSWQLM